MVNRIVISDEAYQYLENLQREHKKRTWKHLEYADIVDEIIEKSKQFDTIKDTQIHVRKRNLKPAVEKFK